jgi:hypothetical protein
VWVQHVHACRVCMVTASWTAKLHKRSGFCVSFGGKGRIQGMQLARSIHAYKDW